MISKLFKSVFGTHNDRELRRMGKLVNTINGLEEVYEAKSDEELTATTELLKGRLDKGEALDDILPDAFAAVRESSKRSLGLRHFDVQMIGGITLHQGRIAEMRTGEGKTLVATLAAYLNAISGQGVHIITVNDYLARRDAHWMAPVYQGLGLSVGVIQSAGAFGPNNASFIVDPEFEGEIQNFKHLRDCTRPEAYKADITYGTNNEFGFDYLRDNMVLRLEDRTQRGLNFAIVDEVDSILIDEARTPLIISGIAEDSSRLYIEVNKIVPKLERGEEEGEGDFTVDEKMHSVDLTESGHAKVESLLLEKGLLQEEDSLYSAQNLNLLHHVHVALKAHNLNRRDVEYIVQNGEIILIDPHTGRKMPGRRMGEGLHQAIEAKEQVNIQHESQTLASTTFQNFFRLYDKLSGMTGTADTEAVEFNQIYGLQVVVIPTNKPSKRDDLNDLIYLTREEKFDAVLEDIRECQTKGAPVLVGTVSIESSEELSEILKNAGVEHQVLNAKYHETEAQIIAQAGQPGTVTIATNMAGRGTDIVLGGNLEAELAELEDIGEAELEERTKAWEERHAKVIEAGGLHIIGTERHESRRIDNQLRGRAGRQGDPGISRFYLSMEDNLMRLFASDRVRSMMQAIGMERGEAIEHRMVTRSIERAQRKVEGRNFDIRKQLLEYDDVANDQRMAIYQQRNELLERQDISSTITAMRGDVVELLLEQYMPPGSFSEQWDLEGLEQQFKTELSLDLPIREWMESDDKLQPAQLVQRIQEEADQSYERKMVRFQEVLEAGGQAENAQAVIRRLERDLMLQVLDKLWREHLATMDYLRMGIQFRGYAGKNPKQEYKRESFHLFSELLDRVKFEVVKVLARVELANPDQLEKLEQTRAKQQEELQRRMSLKHEQAGGTAMADEAADEAAAPQPQRKSMPQAGSQQENTPFVRQVPKVGRNEPCPCGSGKKYKQCHGKL